MNAPVDVLAVMDEAAAELSKHSNACGVDDGAELREARAAVAELVEAATRLAKYADEASSEGRFADGMGEELTALEDTQAALARVGGAA